MNIQIIQMPYDSGNRDARMGRGPEYFIQRRVDQTLRDLGHEVSVDRIEASTRFTTEIGTTFELNRLLAERVSAATGGAKFILVLAGNCNSCLGTLAGLASGKLGIIWFDAHGDFNTPETTVTGFLDGMGLAMATGRCWRPMMRTIPGFTPVPEANVVLVSTCDFDTEEKSLLKQSDIALVTTKSVREKGIREALKPSLEALQTRVHGAYLHIDMDVLDPKEARANHLQVPGGLTVEQVSAGIRMVREHFQVRACGITAYDPAYDEKDRTLRAGIRIIECLVSQ